MGFGDSVQELLETFSKCLTLLSAFGSSQDKQAPSLSAAPSLCDSDGRSVLRKNLRADRDRVHRVYSSRLSQTGSQLELGDEKARSALRRIIDRLVSALSGLLSSHSNAGNGNRCSDGRLDYNALRALSNSSRVDAIHTIDELSLRLDGSRGGRRRVRNRASSRTMSTSASATSRPSTRSSARSSSKSSTSSAKAILPKQKRRAKEHQHHRHRQHHRQSEQQQQNQKNESNSGGEKMRPQNGASKKLQGSKTAPAAKNEKRSRSSPPSPVPAVTPAKETPKKRSGDANPKVASLPDIRTYHKHVSVSSSSSGSTRLGEIPEKKLRRRNNNTGSNAGNNNHSDSTGWEDVEGYNVQPTYPVRPFVQSQAEIKSKKSFWSKLRGSR